MHDARYIFIERFIATLLIVVLVCMDAFSQHKSIEITEHIWTDSVDAAGLYKKKLENNVACKNIILWVKVKMGKAWIDSIMNNNGLPLRFQWFYNSGPGWSSKFFSLPVDSLHYSKQKSRLDSLRDNTPDNYKLEWVLWSQNEKKLESGTWNVKVVKPNNKLIDKFTINIK